MSDEKFEQGMKIRRSVVGDAHVDRAEANKTAFDAEFQRMITEFAWGTVWAGTEIDPNEGAWGTCYFSSFYSNIFFEQ